MRILLFDDETTVLQILKLAAERRHHSVTTATTHAQAQRQLRDGTVDAVLLDLTLQGRFDYSLLEETVSLHDHIPVVVMTAENSVECAVESMRRGATDYVLKPLVPEKLEAIFSRLERRSKSRCELHEAGPPKNSKNSIITFETREPVVSKVYAMAEKAARTEANIVLLGPSGTGKTVLARHIHANSPRREHPFVVVHCPSLSAALLESELFGHVKGAFTGAVSDTWGQVARADKGTLFLDEIGDLPPEIQAKLLRLLHEGEYERVGEAKTHRANVRIIAATNADLEALMEDGHFREDLFYRLNVVSLRQPALIDRPRDILPMAERYIQYLSAGFGCAPRPLSKAAADALTRYDWPGNFRELRNVIEHALVFCEGDEIDLAALPESFHASPPATSNLRPGLPVTIEELEKEHIRLTMERETTIKAAAESLGIDTATLYRKRRRMGSHDEPRQGETTGPRVEDDATSEVEHS